MATASYKGARRVPQLCPASVPGQRPRTAGAAHDRAQHKADDDRVIGVAERRYEVGHNFDRDAEPNRLATRVGRA